MSSANTFVDIMNSNIRPKCEPFIMISGEDETGEQIVIIWNAKDIKSLSYRRSVDVTGRELPQMELQWTEVYYGKLNEANFPLKYNNVAKYMRVILGFEQSLSFSGTWKQQKKNTWKELKSKTWAQVKKESETETIYMPAMFLGAQPEVSGKTIKWVAKDALSFLTLDQTKAFFGTNKDWSIKSYNPLIYLMINARGDFRNNLDLFYYLQKSILELTKQSEDDMLTNGIIFEGATNSLMMNYLSPRNQYLDFADDRIIIKNANDILTKTSDEIIPLKLQYGTPKISLGLTMGDYNYKRYKLIIQKDQVYSKEADEIEETGTEYKKYTYYFKDKGILVGKDASSDIKKYIEFAKEPGTIQIYPLVYNETSNTAVFNNVGEPFEENNKLNVYEYHDFAERAVFISKWFKKNWHSIETTTPAMFHYHVGDLVNFETLIYNNNGESYVAPAIITEINISYNGAVKETIKAHEIKRG